MYRARFDGRGYEQHGERYAVVMQSDHLNLLSTWIVAPTTGSKNAQPAVFRTEVIIEGRSGRILVEQSRAFDVSFLGELVDTLSPEELWDVEQALKLVLDL